MKARPQQRIDIHLEELDQLIDRCMQAPLSASEGEKLKTAMHAMADRPLRKRNTEETKAVLETPSTPATESTSSGKKVIPSGHGHHAAAAFTGADRVVVLFLISPCQVWGDRIGTPAALPLMTLRCRLAFGVLVSKGASYAQAICTKRRIQ